MMWRLWHRLFGWDYVVMNAHYDGLFGKRIESRIVRVRHDAKGRPYAIYGGHIAFLPENAEYLTK